MSKNDTIFEALREKSWSDKQLVIDGINIIDVLLVLYTQAENITVKKVTNPLTTLLNFLWKNFFIFYFFWRYNKIHSVKKAMFFANDVTHYNQQAAIYEFFVRKGIDAQFVTTKYPFVKKLLNIDPIASTICVNPLRLLWYRWLYRTRVRKGIVFLNSGGMNGKHDFAQIIGKCVKEHYFFVLAYQRQYLKALDRVKPSIVFIGNDLTWEGRLLALCCKTKGIPTANISHGLSELNPHLRHTLVDHYFTWGEPERAVMLEKYRLDPKKILVAGSPFLERKFAHPEVYLYDDNVRLVFENKGTKTKVLVAFSGPGHITSKKHHELLVNCLFELIKEHSETHFVFKLHPKDSRTNYVRLAEFSNVSVFDRSTTLNFDIDKWITYADLIITGSSTATIDAMVRERPVMTIDLLNEYSNSLIISNGVTLHASTCESVFRNFAMVFSEKSRMQDQIEKQNRFVSQYFYNGAQRPSERIFALVGKYLK